MKKALYFLTLFIVVAVCYMVYLLIEMMGIRAIVPIIMTIALFGLSLALAWESSK